MEAPEKRPKTLIPKRAQVPLVAVGLVLLAYFSWDFASNMGWIGGPPKAKAPVVAEGPPPPSPSGGSTAAPAPTAGTPASPAIPSGSPPPAAPVTNLDDLRAPAHDPMAELGSAAKPAPTPAPAAGAPSGPPSAAPPPIPAGEPPPLPPPMPIPGGAQPGFPSPTVGGAPPPAAVPAAVQPVRPAPHSVPAALTVTYPLARRGGRGPALPSVSVMGTISGHRGSLAVVHPNDAARGQYVKPGDTIAGSGARIESISSGAVTVGGRGGSRELSVRTRRPAPVAPAVSETPTEAAPAPE